MKYVQMSLIVLGVCAAAGFGCSDDSNNGGKKDGGATLDGAAGGGGGSGGAGSGGGGTTGMAGGGGGTTGGGGSGGTTGGGGSGGTTTDGGARDTGGTSADGAATDTRGSDSGTAASGRLPPAVAQVFANNCTYAGCHGNQYGNAAMAYTRLTQMAGGACSMPMARPRMIRGNAMGSLVIQKMMGTQPCGGRMPENCTTGAGATRPCVSAADIQIVSAWIQAGAMPE